MTSDPRSAIPPNIEKIVVEKIQRRLGVRAARQATASVDADFNQATEQLAIGVVRDFYRSQWNETRRRQTIVERRPVRLRDWVRHLTGRWALRQIGRLKGRPRIAKRLTAAVDWWTAPVKMRQIVKEEITEITYLVCPHFGEAAPLNSHVLYLRGPEPDMPVGAHIRDHQREAIAKTLGELVQSMKRSPHDMGLLMSVSERTRFTLDCLWELTRSNGND